LTLWTSDMQGEATDEQSTQQVQDIEQEQDGS